MSPTQRRTDRRIASPDDLRELRFDAGTGLLPVVAQDADSGAVLMVAWANREALEASLDSGEMHYWYRSREELWRKGATSGNLQSLVSLHGDCDGDTVLALVRPSGPACHTGEETCFGAGAQPSPPEGFVEALDAILALRQAERPQGSYTVRLLEDENLRLKKLGEETAELVTALARGETSRIPEEAADLIYHLVAALRGAGIPLEDVKSALAARRK
jgi:phosphoribosyl-ATP pyrophosphohydrolase/phosphoribosyl-AMP cyclohydrolase